MIDPDLRARLAAHPFCDGLPEDAVDRLAACATSVRFAARQRLVAEGQTADATYLIASGRVALEVGHHVFETLEPGELLGWSWLYAPYPWGFDAVAVGPVEAIRLEGLCLRAQVDADPAFGLLVTRRILFQVHRRLERARLRALDVYGGRG